ncbi:MAG: hypothetical protein EKK57_06750 [Proteobacteria bacterium]|nr:MAG: hypothetical protein EKK57_06750 [Pseudomonadota bacterium]
MGKIFVLSSSILLALSTVFAHYLIKGINPLTMVLYSFSISLVFFNLLATKDKTFLSLVKANLGWVIFVNITTALDWLLIFVALRYISASLINCFVFGAAPIAALLLTFKTYTSRKIFFRDLISCILICFLLIILSICYLDTNVIAPDSIKNILWGIFLSSISGLATGATIYGCKKLQLLGFSTISVMRSRFVIIIAIALILILLDNIPLALPFSSIIDIVILSFLFVIIPTFLLQKGIERTLPVVTTIITSLVPVLTYIFQFFEPDFVFSWNEILIISALSIVVILANLFQQKSLSSS